LRSRFSVYPARRRGISGDTARRGSIGAMHVAATLGLILPV